MRGKTTVLVLGKTDEISHEKSWKRETLREKLKLL